MAATSGASAIVEIFLALLLDATRERRAAIDERLDLLDLHAGRPEPMGGLLMPRDEFRGSVESLPFSELDGPVCSNSFVGLADESQARRDAHGGAATSADVHEIVAHRPKRAPSPLVGNVERAQESVPTDEENFQKLIVDVVERYVTHHGRGGSDNRDGDVGGQLETASGLRAS